MALASKPVEWFDGSVVLHNQEVLTGKISIQAPFDVIVFRTASTRMVYPAHKIHSIFFYDADANINRRFVSIKDNSAFKTAYYLYEVVVAGEVSVLRRKIYTQSEVNDDATAYVYYTENTGDLTSLKKFRKEVYKNLLLTSGQRLSYFVQRNRLNPNDAAHAVMIVQEYNRLINIDLALATN